MELATPSTAADGTAVRQGVLRPESIRLVSEQTAPPEGRNALRGTVTSSLYMGPHDECMVDIAGTPLRAFSLREMARGTEILVTFRPRDCHLLPLA